MRRLLLLLPLAIAACSNGSGGGVQPTNGLDAATNDAEVSDAGSDAQGSSDAAYDAGPLVMQRPFTLKVPKGYDASKATPLVVLFHGYGATGAVQTSYFKLDDLADAKTFLLASPDGTLDSNGKRFWNASDACCDFFGAGIDDVAYARAILDDVTARYNVDPKRVFIVGHSNGAFMAHRLACELSGRVAGIVSLAGAVWTDAGKCTPSAPVAVLQVHGDADTTVLYTGGRLTATMETYPGARATMTTWGTKNGCTGALAPTGQTLDLESTIAGAETKVEALGGCSRTAVELWTMQGAPHIPTFQPIWAESIYGFLMAHPKP